jgi:site-specific DNA-methyltransferase (adenine-specific)
MTLELLGELELNKIHQMDCLEGMNQLIPDNSIDLVMTSPPYANLRGYGKEGVGRINPDDYVEWFKPIAKEIYRCLKPSGSFILNINDRVVNGERHLYVFDLVAALKREVGFKYFERFIWLKKACHAWSSPRKVTDEIEYVFWFYKENYTLNIDDIRREYSEASLKRFQYGYSADKNGFRKDGEKLEANPKGAKPGNLLFLPVSNVKGHNHVAPYPEELSNWFIKAGSNKGDIVMDPFMGSGTTAVSAVKLGRNFIGFEVVPEYIEIANMRLEKARNALERDEN